VSESGRFYVLSDDADTDIGGRKCRCRKAPCGPKEFRGLLVEQAFFLALPMSPSTWPMASDVWTRRERGSIVAAMR
jgi:hypothetical protein